MPSSALNDQCAMTHSNNDTDCKLINEGTKFLWRSNNHIDVAIVTHAKCDTIEAILYHPKQCVEFRLYLRFTKVMLNIENNGLEAKFKEEEEKSYRHHSSRYDPVHVRTKLVNEGIVQYIYSRIALDTHDGNCTLFLQPSSEDNIVSPSGKRLRSRTIFTNM